MVANLNSLNPLTWQRWVEQESQLENLPEIYKFLSIIKGKYGKRSIDERLTIKATAIFIVFAAELCNAIARQGYSTEKIGIVLNGSTVFHVPQSSKIRGESDLDTYVAIQKNHSLACCNIKTWYSLVQEARAALSSLIGEESVPSIQVERTIIQDSVEV